MPRLPTAVDLFNLLAKSIGQESAQLELRWMQQELKAKLNPGIGLKELTKMVRRRVDGEPLQYILGNQPFGPLTIKTRPPTLIPRPETENWALRVASLLDPSPSEPIAILDLCTGSGCIPILLGHLWRQGSTRAYGVDISPEALSLASENAIDHLLYPSTDPRSNGNTFDVLRANILDESFLSKVILKLRPPFDVITSNPPYIPLEEYEALPRSVKNYEDRRALLGGGGCGLDFYHAIAELISVDGMLKKSGFVVLEVGRGQAREVENILVTEGGIKDTEIWTDLWGIERVVLGRDSSG